MTIYSRANAVYTESAVAELVDSCPNLVGFKDGVGNIEQMTRIYAAIGDRLTYIGGLPTAEMFALPYLALGVTTYSSAIYNFVPEFALAFYAALRRGDTRVRHQRAQRVRDPVLQPAQPQAGLRRQHHQGRHEGHRPRRRPGAFAR